MDQKICWKKTRNADLGILLITNILKKLTIIDSYEKEPKDHFLLYDLKKFF